MQSISLTFARALADAICTAEKRIGSLAVEFENAVASCTTTRLPMSQLSRFLEQAQLRSGDEDLGLLAYKKAHPGHLGVLGYAIMSSSTLGDAMARMVAPPKRSSTSSDEFLDTASLVRASNAQPLIMTF